MQPDRKLMGWVQLISATPILEYEVVTKSFAEYCSTFTDVKAEDLQWDGDLPLRIEFQFFDNFPKAFEAFLEEVASRLHPGGEYMLFYLMLHSAISGDDCASAILVTHRKVESISVHSLGKFLLTEAGIGLGALDKGKEEHVDVDLDVP